MSAITVKGLSKSFGSGEPVLRDCNLTIDDHEFLVLVGPSGSGKTTLLRIISGLETPSEGDVFFGDRRVNDVDVGDRDIAMVFQNYGLYPHMSVYKNLAFGLRRRKVAPDEIDRLVTAAAGTLGLTPLLDRKPRQLSGGQRQRVALGRAIVRDPEVFLLDEPLSNLDAHLRTQMRAEIIKVHRAVTATAVYVTHDQVEALTMGDRVAVMHEGVIQQVDAPETLYDRPANRFVAGFIGNPPMSFLDAKVSMDGSGWRAETDGVSVRGTFAADTTADSAVLGLRPEALSVAPESAADGDGSWLRGVVDLVEPLGSEYLVQLTVGSATVTARLPRGQRVKRGETVTFTVADEGVHLFDPASGVSLRGATAGSEPAPAEVAP